MLLLRLSAVLRNALVLCEKLINHWNCFRKNTWPEFQPSLPRGLTVRGKGSVEREIALEKKGVQALRSYLAVRPVPESTAERLFLNYKGEPISERGVRKLVVKYTKAAGI